MILTDRGEDNMKGKMLFIPALVLIFMLGMVGCSEDDSLSSKSFGKSTSVDDVLDSYVAESDDPTLVTPTPEENIYDVEVQGTDGVDVDLTQLSATMVYTEVYGMMVSPEDYVGKRIRMEGNYASYHDEATGKDYSACIIQDATQCCAQGIEFELKGKQSYPKDGDEICVTGIFRTYKEGEATYCVLKNARIES